MTSYDSFWTGFLELASIPVFLVAVGWFTLGIYQHVRFFDDDHLAPTVLLALLGPIAVFFAFGFRVTLRRVMLECPCPCCGASGNRQFARKPAQPGLEYEQPPTACGHCLGYLRATGLEVREESDDRVDGYSCPYELPAALYAPEDASHPDGKPRRLSFKMPPMCAYCCAPDAPYFRRITFSGLDPTVGGDSLVLDVVGAAADSAVAIGDPSDYWRLQTSSGSSADPDIGHDARLDRLKAPVCGAHNDASHKHQVMLADIGNKLGFASYRYYKAFCELNDIRPTTPRKKG